MARKKKMCPKCGKNEAQKPHTCPYAEDIHSDHESLCMCCEQCERECARDI